VSGWGSNQPTGLIQAASVSIGSAGSAQLIPASANGARLLSLVISSIAVTPAVNLAASWVVEDVVHDSNGTQYLAAEIGLPAGAPWVAVSSAELDEGGIVVPAGVIVRLLNGGAAGTTSLRRCSASATYIIL
jgi:hypothetical protein